MIRGGASPGQVAAVRLVLAEMAELFEEFPGAVVAGGSVPYLLIPQEVEPHEGTVDIDVVLHVAHVGGDSELTLHEVLERALFQQDTKRPFRWTKCASLEGENHTVLLELLGGGDQTPSGLRRNVAEDVYVSVIPGIEVALVGAIEVPLPEQRGRRIRVGSIPAFFAMKAAALSQREDPKKSKDAYDIVYCLRCYPGGAERIAEECRAALGNALVAKGIKALRMLFASEAAMGPQAYARGAADTEDAALMKREAFERVQDFLALLQI